MKLETRRAALRAAQAIAGVTVACSATPPAPAPVAPAPSCTTLVDRFFPNSQDPYAPETHVNAPADVERCCLAALRRNYGDDPTAPRIPEAEATDIHSRHRWDCCTAVDHPPNNDKLGSACTPWGPPVPPPMRRRRPVLMA